MVRTRGGGHAAACHMTGRRRGVGCGAGTVAPGGGRPRPIRQGVGYEAEAPAAVAAHPALGRPRPRPRPRESRSVRRAFLARPVRRRCAAPPRPLFPKGGRMRRTAPLPGSAGRGEGNGEWVENARPARRAEMRQFRMQRGPPHRISEIGATQEEQLPRWRMPLRAPGGSGSCRRV